MAMTHNIIYVELKMGSSDNGPAWIGHARYSRSGRTIYFNNQAFQTLDGQGISGNFFDVETMHEYWISRVKRNQQDRHWSGSGKIKIDKAVVDEYKTIIGADDLDLKKYEIVNLDNSDAVKSRTHKIQNQRLDNSSPE
ncbi:MAG: hypothetical protein Tsb009_00050 [Planctomycetaceae bacterium]